MTTKQRDIMSSQCLNMEIDGESLSNEPNELLFVEVERRACFSFRLCTHSETQKYTVKCLLSIALMPSCLPRLQMISSIAATFHESFNVEPLQALAFMERGCAGNSDPDSSECFKAHRNFPQIIQMQSWHLQHRTLHRKCCKGGDGRHQS